MIGTAMHPRDTRLCSIPWLGSAGLAALRRALVAVIGVGNLGGQLAYHLVLMGMRLLLIDRGLVEAVNLGTQGFDDGVGAAKVEVRARLLAPLNPFSRIEPLRADIRHIGLGALRNASLLISCLDNPTARLSVNNLAMRLGLPWLDAGLDGSGRTLFARVAAYGPGSACYLCPHDAASLARLLRDGLTGEGCSREWLGSDEAPVPPTLAISALGGAAASLQAIWALRILLGRGDEVFGREVYFDLDSHRMSAHKLVRSARCLTDHRRYELSPVGSGIAATTVEQTFEFAEARLPGDGDVTLHLQSRTLIARLRCPYCGAEKHPYRMADQLARSEAACECGKEMQPAAADLLESFGRHQAREILGRSWASLGMPAEDVLVAVRGERELALLMA